MIGPMGLFWQPEPAVVFVIIIHILCMLYSGLWANKDALLAFIRTTDNAVHDVLAQV